MQSKRNSVIEVLFNTFTGMVGSWLITYVVFMYVDDRALAATITVISCTVWSLLRGYFVRRYFNRVEEVKAPKYKCHPNQPVGTASTGMGGHQPQQWDPSPFGPKRPPRKP